MIAATSGAVASCGNTPGTSRRTPSAIKSAAGRCGVSRGKSAPFGAVSGMPKPRRIRVPSWGGDLDTHAAYLVPSAVGDVARGDCPLLVGVRCRAHTSVWVGQSTDAHASMRPAPDINQQGVITTRHIPHGGRHEIGGMCIEVAPP